MSLYSPQLIAFSKDMTFAGHLEGATHSDRLSNPLCGDRVDIDIMLEQDRITQIRHHTRGCVLCQASAHLLCQALEGRVLAVAAATIEHQLTLISKLSQSPEELPEAHALKCFDKLHTAPSRQGCVELPWTLAQKMLF